MVNLKEKSMFYKALSEPIRLQIIDCLIKNHCACICELTKSIKRDQSVVFRHIQILENAGIVETKKQANFLICCIKDKEKIKKYLEE